jgi:magnesium-transporting ATPase (P-type)
VYAVVIIFITSLSLMQEALQVRGNQQALQRIAGTQVPVDRAHITSATASAAASSMLGGGAPALHFEEVMSAELMPGDVVRVKTGDQAPCDLVLLAGQLVVSEVIVANGSSKFVKI